MRAAVAPGEFMKQNDRADVSCCVGGSAVLRTGVPSELEKGCWTRATLNQSMRGAQGATMLSWSSNGYKRSQASWRGRPTLSMNSGR
jgi:hypothetical protein